MFTNLNVWPLFTDKFQRYLEHSEYLLETDNQALSLLLAHPRQLGKIGRWVIKISSFKFKTQHLRGVLNVVADTLSRMYTETHDQPEETVPVNPVLLQFPLAFTEVAQYQLTDSAILRRWRYSSPISTIEGSPLL